MEMTLATPALLFPAISLLLLAYTNRFLVVAGLIRGLRRRDENAAHCNLDAQIANLRHRVILIRHMQALGVASLLLCVVTMLLLFLGAVGLGKVVFAVSLVLLIASLTVSLREIHISVGALDLALADMERTGQPEGSGT